MKEVEQDFPPTLEKRDSSRAIRVCEGSVTA